MRWISDAIRGLAEVFALSHTPLDGPDSHCIGATRARSASHYFPTRPRAAGPRVWGVACTAAPGAMQIV